MITLRAGYRTQKLDKRGFALPPIFSPLRNTVPQANPGNSTNAIAISKKVDSAMRLQS